MPMTAAKSIWQIYEIIRISLNLEINNDRYVKNIDRNSTNYSQHVVLDFDEMARDKDGLAKFWNHHQMCQISREIKSRYLDCWEGALRTTKKLYYFTTNRQTSLKNIIEFHRQDEETAKLL